MPRTNVVGTTAAAGRGTQRCAQAGEREHITDSTAGTAATTAARSSPLLSAYEGGAFRRRISRDARPKPPRGRAVNAPVRKPVVVGEAALTRSSCFACLQGLMVGAFAPLRDDLPRAEKKKPPADDEYDGLSSTFAKLCREVDEKQRRKLPDPPDEELHRRLDPILEHYGARSADLVAGGLKLMSYAGKDMVLGIVDKQGRVQATELLRRLYREACALQPDEISF